MAIDGTYDMSLNTPMGKQEGKLHLAVDGGALTGSMEQMGNKVDLANGKVDGNKLSWEASITTPMPMTLKFEAEHEGDTVKGDVELGAFGKASFEGTRVA